MGEINEQIKYIKSLINSDLLDDDSKSELIEVVKLMEKSIDLSIESNRKIEIKYINKSDNENPTYAKIGDSGFDLRANESGNLKPLERKLVGTGLYFELPYGFELQIRPRSGLAYKNGITVLNTPGTVDTGYRGEIKVLLVNLSNEDFSWEKGERIAQGVICHRIGGEYGNLVEVTEINETDRGEGGFGSTGTK